MMKRIIQHLIEDLCEFYYHDQDPCPVLPFAEAMGFLPDT